MGTFEKIRQISPYFFGLVALLLIAYFVFTSGGEQITKQQLGNPQTAVIATVNGEDILRAEFEKRVAERREQMRTQQGENADIDENSIRKEVWDELIEETLLNQEARKAGIMITDDEINDILVESPPDYLKKGFSDSAGNFNRQIYLELITNPDNYANYMPQASAEEKADAINTFRKNLILVSDYLKKQKMAERLTNLMAFASSNFSYTYASEKYIGEKSSADIEYILFDISQVPENTIKVSNAEIKKYYDEKKEYYKQKPQRKIKYVIFPIVPSKADSIKAEKRVEIILKDLELGKTNEERDSIFTEKLNQFNGVSNSFTLVKDLPPAKMNYILQLQEHEVLGPVLLEDATYFFRLDNRRKAENEVVKASHILVTFNNNKDSAKKEIEKILKQVKSGEDFAVAAMKYSSDPGSNKNGGDVGYFSKGQMVKEFEEAAFAAKPGDIVGPIETDYGYHIIKVTDKKSEEVAYSEIMIKPVISSITTNLIKREALSFKSQVEEGLNFDTLAKRLNLNAVESAFFDNTRPVLGSQYLTNICFENEVGTILEPFELQLYGLIVAQITDSRDGDIKPLEDVREMIKSKIIKKKRLDVLKKEVDIVYKKIKESNSLSAASTYNPNYQVKTITNMNNTGIVSGLGQNFALAAKVFTIPVGKISEPIREDKGYFIVKVLSRNVPDVAQLKNEIKQFIAQQKASSKQSSYYQWINKIKEQADIIDYRSKYYREF